MMSESNQITVFFDSAVSCVSQDESIDTFLEKKQAELQPDIVYDVSDDNVFKLLRKIRTERNKLVKAINDRRISIQKRIKETGDGIVDRVDTVYSNAISQFEVEDARRKEEKRKKEEAQRLKDENEINQINQLNGFVSDCFGKDSEYITGVIASVKNIDVSMFQEKHFKLAFDTKEKVLSQLSTMFFDAKNREEAEKERAAIEAERAEIEDMKKELEKANEQKKEVVVEEDIAESVEEQADSDKNELITVDEMIGFFYKQEVYTLPDAMKMIVDGKVPFLTLK